MPALMSLLARPIMIIFLFLFFSEVEGIYVITSGVPDEPKVTKFTWYLSEFELAALI